MFIIFSLNVVFIFFFALLLSTPPSPQNREFLLLSSPEKLKTSPLFILFHQATVTWLHNASSVPPFSAPHPRSSKVQRIHTNNNKKKACRNYIQDRLCGKMLAKAQQWSWGRRMGGGRVIMGLNTKWGQAELWWFATQDWIVILSQQNGGVWVTASNQN